MVVMEFLNIEMLAMTVGKLSSDIVGQWQEVRLGRPRGFFK